jgi:hypothetical protein
MWPFGSKSSKRQIEALSELLLNAGMSAYKAGVQLHKHKYQSEKDVALLREEFGSCAAILNKKFSQRPVETNSLAQRLLSAEPNSRPQLMISREICREFAKVNDRDGLLRAMLRLYWPEFARDIND